jgi:hypothetical protein
VAPLFEQRCKALEMRIEQRRAVREATAKQGLPRLFMLEEEYMLRLDEAELEFTRRLAAEIGAGELDGQDEWASWFQAGATGHPFPLPGDNPGDEDRHEHHHDASRGDER